MGQLVDGIWHPGWYEPDAKGAFQRPATRFRNRPPEIAAGRYHLYVSHACPWAHRTLITRALLGLEDAIEVTSVDPKMPDDGWRFRADAPDPILGATFLRELYLAADARYTGRVTVPVLWDTQTRTIVNNESREVMRILATDFLPLAREPYELSPEPLRAEIDRVLDEIYQPLNNGVYRAGFATQQGSYEAAVRELFDALAQWDAALAAREYLVGDRLTEADIALFTTLLRFDLVYYSHFKCNVCRLRDHANLWRFVRRLYANPKIRGTCRLDEIRTHYYWSQTTVNPTRIVPVGPNDYAAALERPSAD